MTAASYVAVDWGTSSFRLWLVSESGELKGERRSSEGMTAAGAAPEGFAGILERHLAGVGAPAHLPVIICGMAGARQGWVEAGYLDTPAPLADIVRAAVIVPHPDRDIRILPGLAQRDPGAPDVMRGEETQLLGALSKLGGGRQLLCMPGTHSKWVSVCDGTVERFSTYMTGELFDVISTQSILRHALVDAGTVDGASAVFLDAVQTTFRDPATATNRLFTVRSAQLLHGLDATSAKARLSGTLIGLEIAGATGGAVPDTGVCLVASGGLGTLYEAALTILDLKPTLVDADEAVLAGLAAAATALWPA